MRHQEQGRLAADTIILGMGTTGLACARLLARQGLRVLGVAFKQREVGRATRECQVVDLHEASPSPEAVCDLLREIAAAQQTSPTVLPTSDSLALLLAEHRDAVAGVCRVSSTSHAQLQALISKDILYERASSAGIDVPPMLSGPTAEACRAWTSSNRGPYLIKPYYNGDPTNGLRSGAKNHVVQTPEELLTLIEQSAAAGGRLLVQPFLRGGDGWIFDCYGLCDADGRVRVIATHRRLRQYPPNVGITCYGEIPASLPPDAEEELVKRTRRLFSAFPYHGIFGVEWLMERETGRFYLLDVNARPFYTIGHLGDCGLNLPWLAHRELCGDDLADVSERPRLRSQHWLDFWAHAGAFRRLRRRGEMSTRQWLWEIVRCRSFAHWSWRDPRPALWHWLRTVAGLLGRP